MHEDKFHVLFQKHFVPYDITDNNRVVTNSWLDSQPPKSNLL